MVRSSLSPFVAAPAGARRREQTSRLRGRGRGGRRRAAPAGAGWGLDGRVRGPTVLIASRIASHFLDVGVVLGFGLLGLSALLGALRLGGGRLARDAAFVRQ